MSLNILKNIYFENINTTNNTFNKHFHETYTIGITHEGMFKSINLNKSSFSYKNSTRIINPTEIHGGNSDNWKYTNFYPKIELLSSMYEDIYFEKKIPIFDNHIINDIKLYKLLLNFFNSIYNHFDDITIETNLIESLSYLIKNYTSSIKKIENFDTIDTIKHSIEYIKDTLETNISLDDLAKISSLSKYHYLRVFKKQVGLTPHQYILANRINKAKNLVLKGISLSDATYSSGFSDQSHFIRVFKSMYGYSPKHILKKSNFIL